MRARSGVLALAALLGATRPACGLLGGGEGTYRLTAYFPRAVSVFATSDVRVLGLPAGTVREVAVQGDRVRVEMDIDRGIPVPVDVQAQIVPQSLIGERYIQLFPAFQDGMERARDGQEIGLEDTIIPVEPDEALAAVKEFLDSLDPDGLGRLVTNLDDALEGNGAALNDTLASLSEVVATFADEDEALGRIIESFDRLTATLVTREDQLGQVLDAFAEASQVLADERHSIEGLVAGLAGVAREGLALVGDRSSELRANIETLTDAAAIIDANLGSVSQLLEAGGLLSEGLVDAFDPDARAINLRNNFSPLVTEVLDVLLGQLGVPSLCIPVLAECAVAGTAAGAPTRAHLLADRSPVGALLDLLGAPARTPGRASPGILESIGASVRGAADTLLGVTS